MNWQFVIAILIGLYFLYSGQQKTTEIKENTFTYEINNGFHVQLPNTIDFENARVTLVSGCNSYTKINMSGLVHFPLESTAIIDKVKVRTVGGKEYSYAEQSNPGKIVVSPMPCYECDFKGWRH